jgi:hypothetical protein
VHKLFCSLQFKRKLSISCLAHNTILGLRFISVLEPERKKFHPLRRVYDLPFAGVLTEKVASLIQRRPVLKQKVVKM